MLHVEEQRPGVIDVEVGSTPRRRVVLGEGSRVVQVLAAQQWLATPLPLALEMLAAHVMPNHPAVTALVSEAAGVLEEQHRQRRARQGYAARPGAGRRDRRRDRRRACSAAASATASRRSAGPTSASRCARRATSSPGGSGTPLDTVVVLAAALEQAGIRPLLWLADGHAFLGYWREERSAESAATTDAAPLVNLVDLGLIGLVETTLLTSHGRARRRPAPPRLHRLADRRARPDPRRHRRPPRPQGRHLPAAGPGPRRGRRPAGRRVPAGAAQRARRRSSPPPRRRRSRPEAAAAGAAVEERAARPQPAQPADQLHRAVRAWRSTVPGLGARRRWRTSSTTGRRSPCCRPTSWPPSRRSAASPPPASCPRSSWPSCWSSAARCTPTSPPAATSRGCATSPTRRRRCSRRPAPTTSTWRSAAWCGSSTAARCARPLVLIPVDLDAAGPHRLLPAVARRGRLEHPELLPAGEAAPAARPRRPDADRGRRRHPRPGRRAGGHAGRAGRARAALPGRGDGGPRDPAVREVPAVEGPRRALGRLRGEPAGRATWCTSRPRRSPTRPATPAASSTSTSWPRSCPPRPTPRSCGRSPRPTPAARSCSRARPAPASRRPSPTCSPTRSPTGKRVLFVAEKRAALDVVARRLDAVGMGMFALDLHDKGSRASMVRAQIRLALEHAVAVDEQGLAADGGGRCARPAGCWPATPTGCTTTTPPGCRCTRRGRRS